MHARLAVLIMAGSAVLGGCAYGYGGYGSPYGGVSVGVGYGGGYGGYGGYSGYGGCYDPYSAAGGYGGYDYYGYPSGGYGYGSCGYGGYGAYGYGDPYYGWYGDYYYPGSGYYVYDRYRRPHVWNDTQKRYWTERREQALKSGGASRQSAPPPAENWSGFDRRNRADRNDLRARGQQVRDQQVRDQQVRDSTFNRMPRQERAQPDRQRAAAIDARRTMRSDEVQARRAERDARRAARDNNPR